METVQNKVLDIGIYLTSCVVPIVFLQHNQKIPLVHDTFKEPWGKVMATDDPSEVPILLEEATAKKRHTPNIGMYVGSEKNSWLLSIDIDGEEGWPKLRELGVNESLNVWSYSTASNNAQIICAMPQNVELKRMTRAGGYPIDLLVNGYCVIPPSIAPGKDGVWRHYEWVEGKNPFEIHPSELDEPPQALIDWWVSLSKQASFDPPGQKVSRYQSLPQSAVAAADEFYPGGITSGGRNDALASIAGHLIRRFSNNEVENALIYVNSYKCQPPLPYREVIQIAKSVMRYRRGGVDLTQPVQWVES